MFLNEVLKNSVKTAMWTVTNCHYNLHWLRWQSCNDSSLHSKKYL